MKFEVLTNFSVFHFLVIVGAVTYQYNEVPNDTSYRIPTAIQWMFPTPLAILIFFAPESPWWLVRKGRLDDAKKSVRRLGRANAVANLDESVSMMRRTIDLEKSEKEPSLIELWKGTDRYRTLIVCGVYAAQNLTGNLIANQAVYFFKQAGMPQNTAFALGLITSALQTIFVMLSWILTSYLGRRTIYLWGSGINMIFLIAVGIAGSVGTSTAASQAAAALGLIVSVGFTLGPAPASWVIIGETSSIRLRPLTTGVGRASYYLVNIPCIFLSSYMLNPTVSSKKSTPDLINKSLIILHATGCQPRRQVRLRLGRHRFHLPGHVMVLAPRDEGPLVPRDRHPLHPQGPGSQVEENRHRHWRRPLIDRCTMPQPAASLLWSTAPPARPNGLAKAMRARAVGPRVLFAYVHLWTDKSRHLCYKESRLVYESHHMCLDLLRLCRARYLNFRCSLVRLVTLANDFVIVAIDNFILRFELWMNSSYYLVQFEETRPGINMSSQLTSHTPLPRRCHSLTAARRQQN